MKITDDETVAERWASYVETSPLPKLSLSMFNFTLSHWLGRDTYDLNAPYQRGSVWTETQRCALMKSLYMGLPIGAITVAKLSYRADAKSYRVIDGKQRIETVRAFVNGKFTIPGKWLRSQELSTDTKDVSWGGLSQIGQRYFLNTSIPTNEFQSDRAFEFDGEQYQSVSLSDAEALRREAEVFGLINDGGTPHTKADLIRASAVE